MHNTSIYFLLSIILAAASFYCYSNMIDVSILHLREAHTWVWTKGTQEEVFTCRQDKAVVSIVKKCNYFSEGRYDHIRIPFVSMWAEQHHTENYTVVWRSPNLSSTSDAFWFATLGSYDNILWEYTLPLLPFMSVITVKRHIKLAAAPGFTLQTEFWDKLQ